ncbi:HAAS signaling domain-containing protein [Paenibacillus dakarensis]|uniref:HAAS signaling domain-containing protein n=1 Tax=Paenibacillus dakarensis TaxID=1527293 RepID=UPI0006D59AB9|nr:DUF1700 domain-containing protein [Paenibacillus dakarensis]
MNKKQFLSILEARLSPLPLSERNELLSEVATHFEIGLQDGRSEEDIARELGDPFEMAREALGDRYMDMTIQTPNSPGTVGRLFIGIGLLFCALVAVPFLVTLCTGGLALAIGAAAIMLSPVLLLLDYLYNGTFYPAKLFLSISLVGVGILLAYIVRWVYIGLVIIIRGYFRWNVRMMKGRSV